MADLNCSARYRSNMKSIVFLIAVMALVFGARADNDVRTILDRGTMRIAVCSIETPPFFYDMKDGRYTRGIDVELAQRLAGELGITPVWIVKPTFDQVIQSLLDNEADIAISNLSVTLGRATRVKFSTPYIELTMAALVNQVNLESKKNISTDRELLNKPGIRVGFVANSSYEGYARRLFPAARAMGFPCWNDVLHALEGGVIDVALYDNSTVITTIKTDPAISLRFKKIIFDEARDPIAIAIAPDKPELYILMNQFVNLKGAPVVLEAAIDSYIASRPHSQAPRVDAVRRLPPIVFWGCLCLAAGIWMVIIAAGSRKKQVALSRIILTSLYNPAVIIMAMILGCLYGAVFGRTGIVIDSIGNVYLSLLKLCSVPIMVTAIIKSLGSMLTGGLQRGIVKRFVLLLLSILVAASMLGLVGGEIGRPGSLRAEQKAAFGLQVQQSTAQIERPDLHLLLGNLMPSNLIKAAYEENTLGLLIVSILMGIALAVIGVPVEQKFHLFNTFFECFIQIINWSMYLMPFALFSLMAQQISLSGFGFLGSTARLIIVFHVLCLLICMVMVLILSHRLQISPVAVLRCFKNALFVALGTSSSFAAMPWAMNSFKKQSTVDCNLVDMLLPMGVTLFRPGTILTLALGTTFMAQLMGVPVLSEGRFLIIIAGAVVAGLSAAGAPASSELAALAIFLPLLGIPFQVTMVLLLGVNALLDPIRTMTNIISNCALTALVSPTVSLQQIQEATKPVSC